MAHEFMVIVEQDEDGYYIASVPELRGCHTQARSLDELSERVHEAILLCLEVMAEDELLTLTLPQFVGVQRLSLIHISEPTRPY